MNGYGYGGYNGYGGFGNYGDDDGAGSGYGSGTERGREYRSGSTEAGVESRGAYGAGEADIAAQVARYSSMTRDELMNELMRSSAGLRAEGKLDIGRLEEFCRLAAPYLDAEQVARMREIIDLLR